MRRVWWLAEVFFGGWLGCIHMNVSENSGTPKSSILIGFSITNYPFWGTTIYGNTHISSACFGFVRCCSLVIVTQKKTTLKAANFHLKKRGSGRNHLGKVSLAVVHASTYTHLWIYIYIYLCIIVIMCITIRMYIVSCIHYGPNIWK